MNSSIVVKIGIVATVTVGGMDAAVEPSGMSLWRVTGETMTIHPVHLTTNLSSFGAISFSQMNSSVVVKIATVATVIVGGMAALSHQPHRDMGNATMMSGTSLAM
ncbi:hypothetical protein [Shewanella sp. CG12_big_fil_rev_8_21_14_0_65_47_15]|uniref:hypothetical protein n=1 Tax=Shewanella sp. CG12_big_fil_rev_8_21_14_0_65_47_15 TaxID=1975537 RepID=UPI000CB66F76|nr:hypothetical protein [Shewanella sp. CG12_big_fil_rev_8_21_14_0_65_47_15]PIW58715.1 MAG: hypothetical protein COW15_20395 [Shewanella sp. CG12_big_fil_rev_8_21_14_0_65_47_15]